MTSPILLRRLTNGFVVATEGREGGKQFGFTAAEQQQLRDKYLK